VAATLLWLRPAAAGGGTPALFAATLHDTDDKPVALAQLMRGKPLIVNFWARWCGTLPQGDSRSSPPHPRQYAKKGLVVLGIALDDKVEATKRFHAKAYEMRYTGLLAKDKRHRPDAGTGQQQGRPSVHDCGQSQRRNRGIRRTAHPLPAQPCRGAAGHPRLQ
jgi:peroxiredoxin